MKIVKTKEITPKDISEITDSSLLDFKDRAKLHDRSSIPDFFVYIQDYAWNAFEHHSKEVYSQLRHEAQGIFVGYYYKDQFGKFVVATKYEEGNGNSYSAYVEMSEECLAKISERCQNDGSLMLIWIHTHPGFGVFYSDTDYNCLKTNFYKPYQIGLVVDILKDQIRGFKTKGDNVIEYEDFRLFNEEKNLLSLPCKSSKIKVVKESDRQIEKLEKENTELEKENAELKKKIKNLLAEKKKWRKKRKGKKKRH
jgi:proteasome lid subunit RPN8/RPN11